MKTQNRHVLAGIAGFFALWTAISCETINRRPPSDGMPTTAPALGVLHHNYTMHELVGDDLGPGGGALIAAAPEKFDDHRHNEAVTASRQSEQSPVKAVDAHNSVTADLNGDGFVTLDEIVALQKSGLSNREIMDRLRATDQVFSLTPEQEHYLTDRGISKDVVAVIQDLKNLNLPVTASSK